MGSPGGTKPRAVAGLLAGLAVAAGLLLGLAVPAMADSGTKDDKYSLYIAASAAAAKYADSTKPGADCNSDIKAVTGQPGTAGAFIGYIDPSVSTVIGWMQNPFTAGSESTSMAMLRQGCHGSGDSAWLGPLHYAQYGTLLGGLGLDSTSSGFSSIGHLLIGGTTLLAFYGASVADWFFLLPIRLMGILNPFNLLQAVGTLGPLRPAATLFNNLYNTLLDFGWGLAVPLLGALAFFSWLVFGKGTFGSVFKGVLVRVLFLALAVPMMAGLYGTAVKGMSDFMDSGAMTSQVVASRWVDFAGWVNKTRLAVPSMGCEIGSDGYQGQIGWNYTKGAPTDTSWDCLSQFVLAVNNTSFATTSSPTPFGQIDTGAADWAALSAGTKTDNRAAWSAAHSLLLRYMTTVQIPAASYASTVQAGLANGNDDAVDQMKTNVGEAVSGNRAPALLTDDATLRATEATDGGGDSLTLFSSSGGGLSRLSMYNYLTSSFSTDGVVVYGPKLSSSLHTMLVHNSVALSGSGFSGIMNWFSAMNLLVAFMIIGFGYGIAMFIMVFTRVFKLLINIPMAALGSIRSIASALSALAVMLGGLFVTGFLYLAIKSLLGVMPDIAMSVVRGTSDLGSRAFGGNGGFFTGLASFIVMQMLGMVMVIVFVIVVMKVRGGAIGQLEAIVDGVVQKIMPEPVLATSGGSGSSGGDGKKGGGLGSAIGGGVGMGVGMAVGNRVNKGLSTLIGGGGGSGVSGASPSGPSSSGPRPSGPGPGGTGPGAPGPGAPGAGPDGGTSAGQGASGLAAVASGAVGADPRVAEGGPGNDSSGPRPGGGLVRGVPPSAGSPADGRRPAGPTKPADGKGTRIDRAKLAKDTAVGAVKGTATGGLGAGTAAGAAKGAAASLAQQKAAGRAGAPAGTGARPSGGAVGPATSPTKPSSTAPVRAVGPSQPGTPPSRASRQRVGGQGPSPSPSPQSRVSSQQSTTPSSQPPAQAPQQKPPSVPQQRATASQAARVLGLVTEK